MRQRRPLIAALALSVIAVGVLAQTSAPAASSNVVGPLHTSLNQILDANGHPLRLRGINTGKLSWYPWVDYHSPEASSASMVAMKSWGANVVRIPLGEQFWFQSYGCNYQISPADYQAAVGYFVHQVTSHGMLAILDLHFNTVVKPPACYGATQHNMADAARSITFWQQVAMQYRDNPLVAFDLYNEPHDVSNDVWRNGGMTKDLFTHIWYRAAGMQEMYDAVRSTGARNLIFVTGNGWGNVPPSGSMFLNGYNIVYASHYYTCPVKPPPALSCRWEPLNPAPPGRGLDTWTPLSVSQPVALTEFGWPDPNQPIYNQRVIAWAESRGVSWMAFNWGQDTKQNPFGVITDYSVYNPTPSGVPVKNGLALNP